MRSFAQVLGYLALVAWQGLAVAEPGYVIIDPADRFATTYVSLPKSVSQEELRELMFRMAPRAGAYFEEWDSFVADLQKHVAANIQKNEYPDVKTVEGLVALLQKFEGTLFGLTWNGGLAVTYNDYMHAQRTHGRYLSEPTFRARPKDRKRDPVHPGNHLEPLLGR